MEMNQANALARTQNCQSSTANTTSTGQSILTEQNDRPAGQESNLNMPTSSETASTCSNYINKDASTATCEKTTSAPQLSKLLNF